MKEQILSVAIALGMVITSAASSFAGEVSNTQINTQVNTIQPILSQPIIPDSIGTFGSGIDRPGEGVNGPKPGKGPRPPKKDIILLNQGVILNPELNSIRQNLNINNPVLGQ